MTRLTAALALCLASTAFGQTPIVPDRPVARAGNTARVMFGPFLAEDHTTPAAPADFTWSHVRPKTSIDPLAIVSANVTITPACGTCTVANKIVPGCCFPVVLAASKVAVLRADIDREVHAIPFCWTWPGDCGGEACSGCDTFVFDVRR